MKKSLKLILLIVMFISCHSFSNAQELVKPVPNHSVRKAEVKNESTNNVSSVSSSSYTGGNSKVATDSLSQANHVNPIKVGNVSPNPSNATRDSEDYQNLKMEWIKNNPEKFKQLSGNPNLIILTEQELNSYSETEKARILADEINYLIIR